MEILVWLLIVVAVAAVGGTAAVVARGAGLWSPPALPDWASTRRPRPTAPPPRPVAPAAEPPPNGRETSPPPVATPSADPGAAGPLALVAPTAAPPAELARLEERLDRQAELLVARLDEFDRAVAAQRDEVVARQAAVDARQEAALDRLRADLAAAEAAGRAREAAAAERAARLRLAERRAEAAAELYARLARLEAAVAAVTNPILLPGEPYAPPAEFLAEALAWENWKDVGERAFAFADHFNTQRLHLTEPTRREVAAFVHALRGQLTRSVYPNLRPDPSPAQLQALRAALDELAAELPRLRARLADEYQSFVDPPPADPPSAG